MGQMTKSACRADDIVTDSDHNRHLAAEKLFAAFLFLVRATISVDFVVAILHIASTISSVTRVAQMI